MRYIQHKAYIQYKHPNRGDRLQVQRAIILMSLVYVQGLVFHIIYYILHLHFYWLLLQRNLDPLVRVYNGLWLNTLLYADDAAVIGTPESMPHLLAKVEHHSLSLGYKYTTFRVVRRELVVTYT
jgi:hypothetical protein